MDVGTDYTAAACMAFGDKAWRELCAAGPHISRFLFRRSSVLGYPGDRLRGLCCVGFSCFARLPRGLLETSETHRKSIGNL
jgi:hypothetical protein